MSRKIPFILLIGLALTGCAKTNLLYDENAYNYTEFDKNYYTDWEGIDVINKDIKDENISKHYPKTPQLNYSDKNEIKIGNKIINDYSWGGTKEKQFGYNNNLSSTEKKFSYGITSKLFDGRVRCEGLYQKSRIQLDKSGFAMVFPKSLITAKYLGFACRAGTDFPVGQEFRPKSENGKYYINVDFTWSFYIHLDTGLYSKRIYELKDVRILVDSGGETTFVNFVPVFGDEFTELNSAIGMSFEWSCKDPSLEARDLTDDYTENKHHMALMLYEIFIGDSVWH